ncbi:MAG TPA: hypothetical protein VFV57_09245, partial [Limnobacter sp.]|nr:hypothetical protein [Limnobacter sp.]
IGGVLVSKYQNSETVGKDIGLSQLGVGSVFVTTGLAMLTFGAFRLLAEETMAAARNATAGLQPANIPVAQPVAAAGNDLQVHVVHLPGGAMTAASLGVPIDQDAGASREAPVIVINPK